MKRFVEGEDRRQGVLLPEYLDDFVAEENQVRVIEAFVDELELRGLGFEGVVPEVTGRPAYHPATLLKIYVYGYLNRIQSSRRLERETQRNIELMWLTGRLMPDFKTIADFRRDSGPAIRAACAQFVVLCRQFNLFTRTIVAIDGSKSRRSTIGTRTSQWPRSPSALSRWRPASRATWRSWTVPTVRTAIRPRQRQAALRRRSRGGVKVTEARRHAARPPSRERRSMPRERATQPRLQSVSACRLAS